LIFFSLACALFLGIPYGASKAYAAEPNNFPQYLVVHKLERNSTHPLGWKEDNAELFTRESIEEIISILGTTGNENRRLGVSYTFNYNTYTPEKINLSIKKMMELSEEYNIPIVIHLDGVNWWLNTSLWNWFNPNSSNFKPENIHNVERFDWGTGPETAVKVGWRNWVDSSVPQHQVRVPAPQPNLASEAFRQLHANKLEQILPTIAEWYKQLPSDKKYLLGGVVLGAEVSPYWGNFYYPNGNAHWEWEWSNQAAIREQDIRNGFVYGPGNNAIPLGYAAAQTLAKRGVKIQTTGTITAETIGIIINDFLEYLISVSTKHIEPNKLITHAFFGPNHPLEAGIPKTAGVIPGWTTFPQFLEQIKVDENSPHRGMPWAAVEFPVGALITADTFERIFNHGNCRQINIKHWEDMKLNPGHLHAIRTALAHNPGNPHSRFQLNVTETLTSSHPPLVSPGGQMSLRMQADGNVVLAGPGNGLIWTAATYGNPGAYAIMQSNGNFSIVSATGQTLWSSGTQGSGAVKAVLENDGSLALKTQDNQTVWTSRSELSMGMRLTANNQPLLSPQGQMSLRVQADGNLVLAGPGNGLIWAAATYGNPGAYAIMQSNGNFSMVSAAGQTLWTSGTQGSGAVKAVLENNGRLTLKTKDNQTVWRN